MKYEEYTASELAEALEQAASQGYDPHKIRTQVETLLIAFEPILYCWATAYPHLVDADKAYALARVHLRTERFSEAVWNTMQTVAREYARQLQLLGGAKLTLCKKRTHQGTCDFPIKADVCPQARWHI